MTLKELRKQRGISQAELSEMTGINKMQISRAERGETKLENMTLLNAIRLADALGVDVREFINK